MSIQMEIDNVSITTFIHLLYLIIFPQITADVQEIQTILDSDLVKRPRVKRLLENEITQLNDRKKRLEEDLEKTKESVSNSTAMPSALKSVTNYAWDQSKEYVKIYLDIDPADETLEESAVNLEVPSQRSLTLIFGRRKLVLTKLCADIEPVGEDKTHFKIGKKRITLWIKKTKDTNWPSLKETSDTWKKSLEENKEDLSDDPGAGLMNLMKQMYDEGDDDMKRMIAKSWYEARNKNASSDFNL